ncbi:outer membrane beta-barrel protein [Portibacter marinus]|uniref:outer membrane beta-barrel protein n=1 Tax=Portibacter marinus TaxID=2898660 RepID=UPI001F1C9814|nr:outer membrane beta-barrel protein [Portibacter marinus]
MNYKAIILAIICIFCLGSINAQRYNIGIRAGLNYSKIFGPAEQGLKEVHRFNNGIHFGLTYSYKFTERFGIKTEIAYSSVGSKDSIVGDGYYLVGTNSPSIPTFEIEGYTERYLERTNSYINVPFHAYFKPIEKLELFGGPYVAFLINPTAGGTLRFDDGSDIEKYSFIQSLDYNYYTDKEGRGKNTEAITIIVDEQPYTFPQAAGAYYQFQQKNGGLYRWIDAGLSVGAQYYINRSFFAGFRADYGLVDITRKAMDVSLGEFNENSFILRDDFDQNFSMQFSLGFKF